MKQKVREDFAAVFGNCASQNRIERKVAEIWEIILYAVKQIR